PPKSPISVQYRRCLVSKSVSSFSLGVCALSLVSVFTWAQTGVTTSTNNPLQIALLHWYPANLVAHFSVGAGPVALVFDGGNVWVANENDNTVTKLRACDGLSLGT